MKRIMLASLLFVLVPSAAFPICGDVNGDDQVKAGDALTVLKYSVGQSVNMTCEAGGETLRNVVRFGNLVLCNGEEWTAAFTEQQQMRTWASGTGYWSEDQLSSQPTFGPLHLIGAPCIPAMNYIEFNGSNGPIPMPQSSRVDIMLEVDDYGELKLTFYDNGPLETAGRSAAAPFATLIGTTGVPGASRAR